MSVNERLQSVFADILKHPVGPDEDITREGDAAWDSLKHMELVFAMEDEFGVQFTEDDIAGLASRSAFASRISELMS